MLNNLGNSIMAGGTSKAYDATVKGILADKQILAWIIKYSTSEFAGMEISEIIPCIDEPSVASIAVYPGQTNEAITGLPQESKIPGEGVVYYDVRFFAVVPATRERRGVRIIVDVEAQNDPTPGYNLVNRGGFSTADGCYLSKWAEISVGRTIQISRRSTLFGFALIARVRPPTPSPLITLNRIKSMGNVRMTVFATS